jgi:hypothetical protein
LDASELGALRLDSTAGCRETALISRSRAARSCVYLDTAAGSPLAKGIKGVQGTAQQVRTQQAAPGYTPGPFTNVAFAVGVGDGKEQPERGAQRGQKVCVAGPLGTVTIIKGSYENVVTYQLDVFERLTLIDPHQNGFAIKVFMNNELNRVVRPQL